MTEQQAADWRDVGRALLGTWPSQVASWGPEALAAYTHEIRSRQVNPDQAIRAIRSCPADQKFPPSVPELAAIALRDPATPTFAEACVLIFGPHGVLRARTQIRKGSWEAGERDDLDEQAMLDRAAGMHPLVGAFIAAEGGVRALRKLNLDDEQHGQARRHMLSERWAEFTTAHEHRDRAALAAGHNRSHLGLRAFDPLAVIPAPASARWQLQPATSQEGTS